MSRLRIVCKGEPVERLECVPGYPVVHSRPATFCDTFLTLISDDGSEHEITNVERLEWLAEQGSEATRVRIDFIDVDVELEVDLAPLEELEQAVIDWAESKTPSEGPNATARLAELALRLIARKGRK